MPVCIHSSLKAIECRGMAQLAKHLLSMHEAGVQSLAPHRTSHGGQCLRIRHWGSEEKERQQFKVKGWDVAQ